MAGPEDFLPPSFWAASILPFPLVLLHLLLLGLGLCFLLLLLLPLDPLLLCPLLCCLLLPARRGSPSWRPVCPSASSAQPPP